jgi:SAM-dependent methyltransferase
MNCRHCRAALHELFVDLGTAPPSNAYLGAAELQAPESYYPLRVRVCTACWLVQTEDYARHDELFAADYAYFSSFSESWLAHARDYVSAVVERFGLGSGSLVIEVAANDGYLLQYVQAHGIPCLGIEPTASTAAAARQRGIRVREEFFGVALGRELAAGSQAADLLIANNVLAHVPDINDFVGGFAVALKPAGVATFEFPHLLRLVEQVQFDTIYHEHYSYLSLLAVERIFAHCGLGVFDVQELPTHGGSLRVYAQRSDSGPRPVSAAVDALLARERAAGMGDVNFYRGFQARVARLRDDFLGFLIAARAAGKRIAAYGAAAKGNTLLNYAGVRADAIEFVADRNPAKQGHFLPGSRIPVVAESQLRVAQPDYVLLLPWNLRAELRVQLEYVRAWGARLVTAVPTLEIL